MPKPSALTPALLEDPQVRRRAATPARGETAMVRRKTQRPAMTSRYSCACHTPRLRLSS